MVDNYKEEGGGRVVLRNNIEEFEKYGNIIGTDNEAMDNDVDMTLTRCHITHPNTSPIC